MDAEVGGITGSGCQPTCGCVLPKMLCKASTIIMHNLQAIIPSTVKLWMHGGKSRAAGPP